MPRYPELAARVAPVLGGAFGTAPEAATADPVRLHIGDNAAPPGTEIPLARELDGVHRFWHRYPAPRGAGRLRRALAEDYGTRLGLATSAEQILVTPGATSALHTLVQVLCEAGDEVLVPTPVWPLLPGMVRLAGARVCEVPLHDAVPTLSPEEIANRLEAAISERTVMLYLNTPNNPSGTMMDEPRCRAALDVARRHGLWVISDEAYDGMAYDRQDTPVLARLDDRVLAVSTCSKMFRAAGLRIGWVRGEATLIERAARVATFQSYSASALTQALVAPAVDARREWEPAVRADLQERRDRFFAALDLDLAPPAGTYFAFIDLRPWCGPDFDAGDAVRALLERDICVTAGREFGTGYQGWIRACFASEPLDRTIAAARSIGQWVRDRGSRGG